MGIFIGLWLAQIAFGAIVFFTNPKRDDLSSKAQSARSLAIFAGLVPCVGLMLFMQICWLILYRVVAAREATVHRRFQSGLRTSFDVPVPPSQASARDNTSARSDNPFL